MSLGETWQWPPPERGEDEGACWTYGRKAGWKYPASRISRCNVSVQPPLAVGPAAHNGLPRRPIACSIAGLLAAAFRQPLLAGGTHARPMPRLARIHMQHCHSMLSSTVFAPGSRETT